MPDGSERVKSDFNESMRIWHSVEEYASWLRERRPLVDPILIQELASSALRKAAEGGFRLNCDPAMGKGNTAQSPVEIWQLLRTILAPTLVIRRVGSVVVSNEILRHIRNTLRNDTCCRPRRARRDDGQSGRLHSSTISLSHEGAHGIFH
jgi:hypothetical protein